MLLSLSYMHQTDHVSLSLVGAPYRLTHDPHRCSAGHSAVLHLLGGSLHVLLLRRGDCAWL